MEVSTCSETAGKATVHFMFACVQAIKAHALFGTAFVRAMIGGYHERELHAVQTAWKSVHAMRPRRQLVRTPCISRWHAVCVKHTQACTCFSACTIGHCQHRKHGYRVNLSNMTAASAGCLATEGTKEGISHCRPVHRF